MEANVNNAETSLREQALAQLKRKRAFKLSLAIFIGFNALFWLIWALGVADGHDGRADHGLPWPIWVTGFWGVGIVVQGYNAYLGAGRISEAEINREIERIQT